MKKIWVYLLGVLTGVVVGVVILSIIALNITTKSDPSIRMSKGMSFFETPGEVINEPSFKVFQALGDGTALAEGKGDSQSSLYIGLNVLLYNDEEIPYYDEQIVNATQGKCFRQVGIYRYKAKNGMEKTVPIVMMLDK